MEEGKRRHCPHTMRLAAAVVLWVVYVTGCGVEPADGSPDESSSADTIVEAQVRQQRQAVFGFVEYDGCDSAQRGFLIEAMNLGRLAVKDPSFAACVDRSEYVSCDDDGSPSKLVAITASRSANDVRINCRRLDDSRLGQVNWLDIEGPLHNDREIVKISKQWLDTYKAGPQSLQLRGAAIAGTIWHEIMHTHDFQHGNPKSCSEFGLGTSEADRQSCEWLKNLLAAAECQRDHGTWNWRTNTMPYIVARCLEDTVNEVVSKYYRRVYGGTPNPRDQAYFYSMIASGALRSPAQLYSLIRSGMHLHRLRATNTYQCVDVPGSSSAIQSVQGFGCHENANQQWQMLRFPNGTVQIRSRATGMCLDVPGFALGTVDVRQYPCNVGDNQRFRLLQKIGFLEIRAVHSNRCLRQSGSRIVHSTCAGEGFYTDTTLRTGDLRLRRTMMDDNRTTQIVGCVEVPYVTSAPWQVRHDDCSGETKQTWRFNPRGNFRYHIRNLATNQCMTRAEKIGDIRLIRQNICGTGHQDWIARLRADGSFYLEDDTTWGCAQAISTAASGPTRFLPSCEYPPSETTKWAIEPL